MKQSILITIGMPVYNAGGFLREAVDSIICQTYPNWELIMIDDGSTDQEVEHLQKNGFLNDPRIKIYKDTVNKGLATRLNETITLAKGQYFARMDQDDVSLPNRLEEQLSFLTSHPEVDLLATRARTINSRGEFLGELPFALTHDAICAKPWRSFYMPHPTWMGKTQWFRNFKYASPAPFLCEDQELLLRSYSKSKFACLDKALLNYRVRDRVSIKKLYKTYFSIYWLQLKLFKTKVDFLFLSTLVFFGRSIKVLVTLIKQSFS